MASKNANVKTPKSNIDIDIAEVKRVKFHVSDVSMSSSDKSKIYKYKVPMQSKLVLDFKGTELNNIIINTLKRVMFDDIPTYAFMADTINITGNTTIFNNDQMRLRLSQLPVLDTKLDLFYLDPIYWKNVDYSDPKRPKHELEKLIEIQINSYNDTQNVKNVTTNDIRYYVDSTEVFNKYNQDCPVLLTQLKPADSFICHMKAVLGVGQRDNIWTAAGNAYMDDHTTNDITGEEIKLDVPYITFTVESNGQYDEYDILIKSCKYIVKKITDIKQEIMKRVESKEIIEAKTITFQFVNEDHTIGYLINSAFQEHEDIMFSGMPKPDHQVRAIIIKIACVNKLPSPIKPMMEKLDYLVNVYEHIQNKLIKLSSHK